jgi:hypothetical protein
MKDEEGKITSVDVINEIEKETHEEIAVSIKFWKWLVFALIIAWIADPLIQYVRGYRDIEMVLPSGGKIIGRVKVIPSELPIGQAIGDM